MNFPKLVIYAAMAILTLMAALALVIAGFALSSFGPSNGISYLGGVALVCLYVVLSLTYYLGRVSK